MAKQVDLPTTPQDLVKAAMTKKYLKSIDAKETVGKMTDMLDTCNNLTKSPAVPGNEVIEMAEKALTEENLKQMKDTSDKLIDSLTSPETPDAPAEQPKENVKEKKLKAKAKELKTLANSNKE
jgi:hypothetical protein